MRASLLTIEVEERTFWLSLLVNLNNNRSLLGVFRFRGDESVYIAVWLLFFCFTYDDESGWEVE